LAFEVYTWLVEFIIKDIPWAMLCGLKKRIDHASGLFMNRAGKTDHGMVERARKIPLNPMLFT
jgi:hypothetical protein